MSTDAPDTSGFSPEKVFTTVDEGGHADEQTPSPEKINSHNNSHLAKLTDLYDIDRQTGYPLIYQMGISGGGAERFSQHSILSRQRASKQSSKIGQVF